jgi:hypothetical protein
MMEGNGTKLSGLLKQAFCEQHEHTEFAQSQLLRSKRAFLPSKVCVPRKTEIREAKGLTGFSAFEAASTLVFV